MRKIVLWVVPFCICLLIAVSYLPIALGFLSKIYFQNLGWEIRYASIIWKGKSLILSDLNVKHPSFALNVPTFKIHLFDHHLSLSEPVIQVFQIPDMLESTNWTYTIENGRLEKEGLPPAFFSIHKAELLEAKINAENGWMQIEMRDQDVSMRCDRFPLCYLNLEGVIDGHFQMHNNEMEWDCRFEHVQSCGKGFLHGWIVSELRCGDAKLCVINRGSSWEIVAEEVGADLVTKLQKIAEQFGYSSWILEEGVISGLIHIEAGDFKIQQGNAKHLRLRKGQYILACEEAKVLDGQYTFKGGSFFLDGKQIGVNWEGRGDLFGNGSVSGTVDSFTVFSEYSGNLNQFSAHFQWNGPLNGRGLIKCERANDVWRFSIDEGAAGYIDDLQMHGEMSSDGISCYDVKGVLNFSKKVPFYCPIIQSEGQFDVRLIHPLFDIARLSGTSHLGNITFDLARSHVLGSPMTQGSASMSQKTLDMAVELPWRFFTFFTDLPTFYDEDEVILGQISVRDDFTLHLTTSLNIQETKIPVVLQLARHDSVWNVTSEIYGGQIEGNLLFDHEGLLITRGKGFWEKGIQGEFSGRISSFEQGELNLSNLQMELGVFRSELQGSLQGEGILHWKGVLEADFDLIVGKFKINDWTLENAGSLHIFCSPTMGVVIQGLNVAFEAANCKIGLLQYKSGDEQPIFSLTQSQFYVPSDLLAKFGFNDFAALQGVADLSFSSDLSKVSLSMKEALCPVADEQFCVRNVHAVMNRNDCRVNLDLDHHSRLIPIDLTFQMDSQIKGRCIIENSLTVDWTYQGKLCVQSIEGKCLGVEASFHLDGDSLIGRAQINGNELKILLPEKIAEIFHELKIGNGYEIMGRLNFKNGLGFKGILSGKQIELFGFDLRNILSQIEWDRDHLFITDLKISDFAGVLKIEKILAQGVGNDPWTLSIPHIVITELRPSLLQDVGGPPGQLSPLVIREIRIDDFHGFVDDSKTYTAKGELFFINSYKREDSILELPSDILSRIVGLDIELLTPVCGTLKYELHDGFFHFTELSDAYSENKRSEFFLVFNEDSPKMDLDWNLNIFIQTKQFVLFKFTEAFLISVTGKLDAPKFQLQRKKRFLGVL